MSGNNNEINPATSNKNQIDAANVKDQFLKVSNINFEIKQYDTIPLAGFEMPEGFPHCCEYHTKLFQDGVDYYTAFPNCCDPHKKLNTVTWFNKENYNYLPLKFVTTLWYTIHCVLECINNSDWYNKIVEYIEYTKDSYGQLPNGFGNPVGVGLYLNKILGYIETAGEVPDAKKIKLIKFIKNYFEGSPHAEQIDINVLIKTYKEWLNTFPFDLSYFKDMKPYFENQLPILIGQPEYNRYTGISKVKVRTYSGLMETLNNVTNDLLTKINGVYEHENGLIDDINKLKLELVIESRKLKLKQGYNSLDEKPLGYEKMLIEWFNDEMQFIADITPLISQAMPLKSIPAKPLKSWQGTSKQKEILFNELASRSFIDDNEENKRRFLNDERIIWNTYGRTLFYLLDQLKNKRFKLLPVTLNIAPFVYNNFLQRNGEPFKNVNQSISSTTYNKTGTNSKNSYGKPVQYPTIDEILSKL